MNLQLKRNYIFPVVLCILVLVTACDQQQPSVDQQQPSVVVFDTPEAAIETLFELISQPDDNRIEQVFGAGSLDMFRSGDTEADSDDFQRVNELIAMGGVRGY